MAFENTIEALQRYGQAFVNQYKANLELSGRRASGKLLESINTTVTIGNNNIQLILNMADYAQWIEEGRPATSGGGDGSLYDKILEWIKVKPVLPRERNGKLPTEKQLAYLITRKIHREGYSGSHDIVKTKFQLENVYKLIIKEALKKDFINEYKDLLK